jgi:hypothetical protein
MGVILITWKYSLKIDFSQVDKLVFLLQFASMIQTKEFSKHTMLILFHVVMFIPQMIFANVLFTIMFNFVGNKLNIDLLNNGFIPNLFVMYGELNVVTSLVIQLLIYPFLLICLFEFTSLIVTRKTVSTNIYQFLFPKKPPSI